MTQEIRISRIKQVANGYRVEVSGREEPVLVPAELLHRHRLKEGIVITRPQYSQLLAEAELAACEQTVGRLLALREHTVGEVRAKLARRKLSPEAIEPTIRKYQANGLLDDARVADQLARQTFRRKPCGRSFMLAVLRRKMIERTLAERTADQLLDGEDETAIALKALQQKWPQPDQIDVESVRRKAYSYLSRRGFGYRAARAAWARHFNTTGKVDRD